MWRMHWNVWPCKIWRQTLWFYPARCWKCAEYVESRMHSDSLHSSLQSGKLIAFSRKKRWKWRSQRIAGSDYSTTWNGDFDKIQAAMQGLRFNLNANKILWNVPLGMEKWPLIPWPVLRVPILRSNVWVKQRGAPTCRRNLGHTLVIKGTHEYFRWPEYQH